MAGPYKKPNYIELKASEKMYRTLVEHAHQGIISIDNSGDVTFANKMAAQILGYELEALSEKNILDLVEEKWVPAAREMFLKARKEPVEQEEINFIKAGGKPLECMINGGPVIDENNRPQGYTIFITDLSETKSLREQLYTSEKMTAIGRLAGGIAHEFNNIHAAIQGYTELLLRQPHMEKEDMEDLQAIRQLIVRASHITQQLLVFARRDYAERDVASLPGLVDSNVRMIKKEFESEGIKIKVTHHHELPEMEFNPGRIGQVIMEFIINAKDAVSEAPEKIIKVETGKKDDRAYFSVRDSGTGITPDARQRIFDPFYTTKGALGGSVTPGTGLGLSAVHSIVKDHRGSIEVNSEPGNTAFTVWLPIKTGDAAPATRTGTFGPVAVGARILIVDDEMDIVYMLERALAGAGYQVEVSTRAKEALRKLHSSSFHLALVDLQMPDMSGEELLEKIMEIPPHLRPKTAAVTGKAQATELKKVRDMGVDDVIKKPFSMEDLFTRTYNILTDEEQT